MDGVRNKAGMSRPSGDFPPGSPLDDPLKAMQFQFHGHEVHVFRLSLDPATGQRQRTNLGMIDKTALTVSATLKANCSPAELTEIDRWLANRQRLAQLRAELAARTLPEQIQQVAQWLSTTEPDEQTRRLAEDIRANWQRLRTALQQRDLL